MTGDNAGVSPSWISVITVVKNDPDGFSRTLDSLSDCDLGGVEFVVIDSSSDRSAVPSLLGDFPVTYAWLPPAGIYSAMNAALQVATGDLVYFANAGDTIYAPDVLARAHSLLRDAVWGHGPVSVVEQSGREVVTPAWDYAREKAAGFSRGHFPAHQGTFARRDVLLSLGGFDTSYDIAGDYAMALRLSQVADPVELPFVIARFHEGGASTLRWQDSFSQFQRARREILRPRGMGALRQGWHGAVQYGSVWLHRKVLTPLRGDRQ